MPNKKRISFYAIFTIILLVGTFLLAELVSFVFISVHLSGIRSRREILNTLDIPSRQGSNDGIQVTEQQQPSWMQSHVLHPYVGFVRNNALPRQVFNNRIIDLPVNEYGFFGTLPPTQASNQNVTVALTGGSVTLELFLYAGDLLKQGLQDSPAFRDRNVDVVCLALGGMKQPQQLMVLNYFLSLGYHFDVLINCDGFNEVALPFAQNIPYNISPFYPRAWGIYATKALNTEAAILYGRLSESKKKTERWRSFVSRSPYRHSNVFLFLWHLIRTSEENKQNTYDGEIREILRIKKHTHPQETGPSYARRSKRDIFSDLAQLWKRSSVQMAKLCMANDIRYFHFLQPNQYVKDSKPLNDWERRHIYAGPDNLSRQGVELGYPGLFSAGEELIQQGVPFYDLTNIFRSHSETIYRDNSCHYNQSGYRLLAQSIVGIISTH